MVEKNKTLNEWTIEIQKLVAEKFPMFKATWKELPKCLMYIVTECAEGMEAWREDDREGLGEEFADIIIRTLDYAYKYGYNINDEIEKKMKINWKRPLAHGKVNV